MALDFRLLGPLEVVHDGAPLTVPPGRVSALLVLLLLRRGRVVERDRLIHELWGDEQPDNAVNALQALVSRLRRALKPAADGLVAARETGYVLLCEPEQVDLSRFELLVRAGGEALAEGEHRRAVRLLADSLELWRGPELAHSADLAAAAEESRRLEEVRLQAEELRAEAALALGGAADLVPELEAFVAANPLRERARGHLMLALYRDGRQADALAVYRQGRDAIVDELGLDPSPALRELEQAILRQDAGLVLPAGPPPLPRLRPPQPAAPLIGRRDELALAAHEIAGGARILTLVGPGGIGKTRLALEIARTLEPRFAEGAAFVPLDWIDDPEQVAPQIAAAIGLEPEGSLPDQLRARELLLVLDNFEQILEAAPLLAEISAAAPGVQLVVTSRALLRLSGERPLAVPPLEREGSALLFVRRAEATSPGFSAVGHEEAIREICDRLEGLPLAIELAAARTSLLPPDVLLDRLESGLALAGGSRDAPERQQTIRNAIAWSFGLLDANEQRLLAELSAFVGGATISAAVAVASLPEDEALEGLASLVDQSLVRRSTDAEPRLSMLELVREFAREQLSAYGDRESVFERHLAFFAELAEAAESALHSPDQRVWFERLEAESGNLRIAIRFALYRGESETALAVACALAYFWRVRGHLNDARTLLAGALAGADDAPAELASRGWNELGIAAGEQGDFEAAADAFDRSLSIARTDGDEMRVAIALSNLGHLALFRSDLPTARSLFEEAASISEQLGDRRRRSTMLESLATIALLEGRPDQAIALLEETLAFLGDLGDAHYEGSVSRELARAWLVNGDPGRASPYLDRSLELATRIGDRHKLAQALDVGAVLLTTRAEHGEAVVVFATAAAARDGIGASRPPDQRAWLEEAEATAREHLGAEATKAAAARGRALPPEEAAELVRTRTAAISAGG
jgi:predicted ATPase/DNA-binding SARP family transcriptional activator